MKTIETLHLATSAMSICVFASILGGCCTCRTSTAVTEDRKNTAYEETQETLSNDSLPGEGMIAGGFGGVFDEHLFHQRDLIQKLPADGGRRMISYNPEVDAFNSVYFACALCQDIVNDTSYSNLTRRCTDLDKNDCILVNLNHKSLNEFNLSKLLSAGDVIGYRPVDKDKIRDYDDLVKKGVKFVDCDILHKNLFFKAGEDDWAYIKIYGKSHTLEVIAQPNTTGKERSIAVSLNAIYLQAGVEPFLNNVIQFTQPPL